MASFRLAPAEQAIRPRPKLFGEAVPRIAGREFVGKRISCGAGRVALTLSGSFPIWRMN
jgi:hypothetical protein